MATSMGTYKKIINYYTQIFDLLALALLAADECNRGVLLAP